MSSLGNPLLVSDLAGEDRVQLKVIEGFLRQADVPLALGVLLVLFELEEAFGVQFHQVVPVQQEVLALHFLQLLWHLFLVVLWGFGSPYFAALLQELIDSLCHFLDVVTKVQF